MSTDDQRAGLMATRIGLELWNRWVPVRKEQTADGTTSLYFGVGRLWWRQPPKPYYPDTWPRSNFCEWVGTDDDDDHLVIYSCDDDAVTERGGSDVIPARRLCAKHAAEWDNEEEWRGSDA